MANTPPREEQVRAALDELLGWSEIARSPQLASFLAYIVNSKLRGEESGIKAYSIAVDVFGRPPTFDPQRDPIVRVQARRLRSLLGQFYGKGRGTAGVQITLPVGRYVPEFLPLEPRRAVSAKSPKANGGNGLSRLAVWRPGPLAWRGAALALGVLGILALGLFVVQWRQWAPAAVAVPGRPVVVVEAFSNLTGAPGSDGIAARLAARISSDLARFEGIEVRNGGEPTGPEAGGEAGRLTLSGIVRPADEGLEVTVFLTDVQSGEVIWSHDSRQPIAGDRDADIVATISRQVARELGPFRSPLHAAGRLWIDEQQGPLPVVSGYICMLTYRMAREAGQSGATAKSLSCHERLLQSEPDSALALAASAWLQSSVALAGAVTWEAADELLAAPAAMVERALQLAPQSSFVHEQAAIIQLFQGRLDAAQQHFDTALELNPLNTDARAGFAISLIRAGDWRRAAEEARRALDDARYPSPWYTYVPGLDALRSGRYAEAIEYGREAAKADGGDFGTLIVLAAAALAGDEAVMAEYLPRAMSQEGLRRQGMLTWLEARIADRSLLTLFATGLARAGVPLDALTQGF